MVVRHGGFGQQFGCFFWMINGWSLDWFKGKSTGNHGFYMFLPSNIGLSCKFSHHPILWDDFLGEQLDENLDDWAEKLGWIWVWEVDFGFWDGCAGFSQKAMKRGCGHQNAGCTHQEGESTCPWGFWAPTHERRHGNCRISPKMVLFRQVWRNNQGCFFFSNGKVVYTVFCNGLLPGIPSLTNFLGPMDPTWKPT